MKLGSPEETELLAQIGEYESTLTTLLSSLDGSGGGDEALAQAAGRLAEFGPLMKRLAVGDLPAGAEFQAKLQAVRLRHGLLTQAAVERRSEVGEALAQVRETRRKASFYSTNGSDVGSSCDMAG